MASKLRTTLTPSQLGAEFKTIERMQAELDKRQRLFGQHAQELARGIADLMDDGDRHFRIGLELWAFSLDDAMCIALVDKGVRGSDYPSRESGDRYAVLVGGRPAMEHIRATEARGEYDLAERVYVEMATYTDYQDFVYRLPRFIHDVARDLERALDLAGEGESRIEDGRTKLEVLQQILPVPRPVEKPESPEPMRRRKRQGQSFKPGELPPVCHAPGPCEHCDSQKLDAGWAGPRIIRGPSKRRR